MPKKWIDKKTAQTFTLVHRSQQDPLYYDPDASQGVFVEKENKNLNKAERNLDGEPSSGSSYIVSGTELKDQEDEFRKEGRRENEGEAALYGILYDDSKYDYMQHLRPIGEVPDAVFIAKKEERSKKPQKGDLLLKSGYAKANRIELPQEVLPSQVEIQRTYQDFQAVPDEIAGFQPDMDPRLREVLEALEDEEYVEDDDDVFQQLIVSGQVDEEEEIESEGDEEGLFNNTYEQKVQPHEGEEDWETAFRQFKLEQQRNKMYNDSDDNNSDLNSEARDEVGSLTNIPTKKNNLKKKKKNASGSGPGSEMSGMSMTSSAMFRNAGLTLLDDRFDRIEQEYEQNDGDSEEEVHQPFDMAKERDDLEDILDDFLDNYVVEGKRLYKK